MQSTSFILSGSPKRYFTQRLREAGFDMDGTITRREDPESRRIIFEQEIPWHRPPGMLALIPHQNILPGRRPVMVLVHNIKDAELEWVVNGLPQDTPIDTTFWPDR